MVDVPQTIEVRGIPFTYLKPGKVKNIYVNDDYNQLLFDYTDRISVFDKVIPTLIQRKGETLCKETAFWLHNIMANNICNTHFIDTEGPNQMIVKRMPLVKRPTTETDSGFIPLEVISRYYLTGSLYRDVRDGKVDYKTLGFKSKPENGAILPEPIVQFETKLEEVDRKISEREAMEIAGLTMGELEEIKETVYAIDHLIDKEVGSRGLIHVDGKKEFAFASGRTLTVIDGLGTPDEDRFWDEERYEKGELVELSKEHVRQIYIRSGYHDELIAARKAEKPEPAIPPLKPVDAKEVSELYIRVYEQITGRAL